MILQCGKIKFTRFGRPVTHRPGIVREGETSRNQTGSTAGECASMYYPFVFVLLYIFFPGFFFSRYSEPTGTAWAVCKPCVGKLHKYSGRSFFAGVTFETNSGNDVDFNKHIKARTSTFGKLCGRSRKIRQTILPSLDPPVFYFSYLRNGGRGETARPTTGRSNSAGSCPSPHRLRWTFWHPPRTRDRPLP